MAPRLRRGPQPLGLVRGGDPRDEGPGQVVAAAGVVGELGGGGGRAPGGEGTGDGPGVGGVPPDALAGEEVLVDRLVEQGVPERVAVLAVGVEDPQGDGGAQPLLEVVVGDPGRGAQQVVADAAAPHGGGPHEVGDVGGQGLQPGQDDVGEGGGQRALQRGAGEQELRGVVGVALGAVVDPAQGRGVDVVAGEVEQELAHLLGGERLQRDAAHRGEPAELGEHRAQRVAPVQVVGADGRDDEEAFLPHPAQQEGQQVPAGAVGPVQVLEHEQDGALAGGGGEGRGDGVEELQRGEVRTPRSGAGAEPPLGGVGAPQRFQRLDEGQVRHRLAPRGGAVAQEHGVAPRARAPGELGDEAGLAHPRVGLDEHGGGRAGPGEGQRLLEGVELGRATDEGARGGRWDGHVAHRGTAR